MKLDHGTWQRPSFQLGFLFGQSKGITVTLVLSIFAHSVSVPPSKKTTKTKTPFDFCRHFAYHDLKNAAVEFKRECTKYA